MKTTIKTHRFGIRLTEMEIRILKAKAKKNKQTSSQFIRSLILNN